MIYDWIKCMYNTGILLSAKPKSVSPIYALKHGSFWWLLLKNLPIHLTKICPYSSMQGRICSKPSHHLQWHIFLRSPSYPNHFTVRPRQLISAIFSLCLSYEIWSRVSWLLFRWKQWLGVQDHRLHSVPRGSPGVGTGRRQLVARHPRPQCNGSAVDLFHFMHIAIFIGRRTCTLLPHTIHTIS